MDIQCQRKGDRTLRFAPQIFSSVFSSGNLTRYKQTISKQLKGENYLCSQNIFLRVRQICTSEGMSKKEQ